MQKVVLIEVFHHIAKTKFIEKLADMFDRFEELQIVWMGGYCDKTRFHKNRPYMFHLWFRSSQFLIYPLVWMAPFLRENQQLPDADARCIRSQTAEQTLENTLHHP